jgi:ATP-dependent protease Clp ATPase subunit
MHNLNQGSAEEIANNDEQLVRFNRMSPEEQKNEMMKENRKQQLNKHGVIPEFIKISEIYQVYTAFTQANLKNSILH